MQHNSDFTREELYKAYFDCVKNKKNTTGAIKFEFELEKNLSRLYLDIINGNYKVGRSSCIVVNRSSTPREIWTGTFRDKIIHHLIRNRLGERYYNKFILNVFNGIPSRGVLLGAMTAQCYAQDITENYTKKAYYLKTDISNFFNSINKDILFEIIKRDITDKNEKWLLNVIKKVIYNNPTKNTAYTPPKRIRNTVPPEKRLHYFSSKKGLPIGNLASQFLSNIYMNELDQFIVDKFKINEYCRYADDMIFFHENAQYLNNIYDEMSQFLNDKLDLKLNDKKKCINLIEKGFDFIGYVIKPNRMLLRAKTIHKSLYEIKKWHDLPNKFSEDELEKLRSKANGYLGLANRVDNFNYRKKLCEEISGNLFIKPDEDYRKIIKLT